MASLKKYKIVRSSSNTSVKVFEKLMGEKSFMDIEYESPKDYINKYWSGYKSKYPNGNININGSVFELIIYSLFYREGLLPFYTQAKVTYVPNVIFDAILYNRSQPISISLKTSLRERYKQADLEAIALKYVHRRAKCYLLTMDSKEAKDNKAKIKRGDIIGLDDIVDCNTDEINELIETLKLNSYEEAECKPAVAGFIVKKLDEHGIIRK